MFFSLRAMKIKSAYRFLLVFLFALLSISFGYAQLTHTINANAGQLVQTLLGQGLTYSNATLNCGGNASATFTYAPDASMSYTNGVILATGNLNGATLFGIPVSPAVNTAASGLMSGGITPSNTDPQLNSLATHSVRADCCVLEFDFVPLGDTVKFNYVFGSEEYPEYVCNIFNDVFGFFVSGANPSGGIYTNQNIALIPGTVLPVAINTVNPGVAGASSGGGTCVSLAHSSLYYNNASSNRIVFDGLTKSLTAMIAVVPCSTYHMKLGVQDVGDDAYDSGVFLQGGSFTSNNTQISSGVRNSTNNSNAAEGCDTGFVQFKINVRTVNTTIRYTVGGTATNGVDYEQIPDSVVIFAGDTIARVPIVTIPDANVEGTEIIKIYLLGECSNIPLDSTAIYLYDKLNLSLGVNQLVCRGDSFTLSPVVSGGSGSYLYSWTPATSLSSTTIRNPTATALDTTVYILTLSDSIASCTIVDSVRLDVQDCNTLVLSVNRDTVCPGDQVQLNATLYRPGFSQWTPASGGNAVSDATIRNPMAIVNSTQTYIYSVTQQDGTVLADSVTVYIDTSAVVYAGVDLVVCDTTSFVTLSATPGGNQESPYQYIWRKLSDGTSQGISQTVNITPTVGTESYVVTLTGGYCTVTDTVDITVFSCGTLSVSATEDTVCPCFRNDSLGSFWAGGSIRQTQLSGSIWRVGNSNWSPASGVNAVAAATAQTTLVDAVCNDQTYLYSVVQADGTPLTDSVTIRIDTSNHVDLGSPTVVQCDTVVTLTANAVGNVRDMLRYNWFCSPCSPANEGIGGSGFLGQSYSNTFTVNQTRGFSATYYVAVQGGYCVALDSVQVTIGNLQKTVSSVDISCTGANDGQAAVTITDGIPPYSYNWSVNAGAGDTNAVSNLAVGTYYVTTSDAVCSVIDTIVITEPSPLVVPNSVVTNATCNGGNDGTIMSVATGGTGVLSYTWNPVQPNSGAISNLTAGNYLLSVTDVNGCILTAAYTITEPDPIVFVPATQTDILCFGAATGSVTSSAFGGTGTLNYTWLYNQNSYSPTSPTNATGLAAGTYSQIATDANGCTNMAVFNIAQPAQLVLADLQITNVDCNGNSNGQVISTASGGTQGYVYSWSHDIALNSDTANGLAGNTYSQTVTDANGCSAMATYTVLEPDALTIQLDSVDESCYGSADGRIMTTFSGGTPAYLFVLSQNGTFVQSNDNGRFSSLSSGDYMVELTDANGCEIAENISVLGKLPDVFTASTDTPSCYGREYTDGAIHIASSGTNAPYLYLLENSGTYAPDSSFYNLGAGVYTVFVRNADGCITELTVRVPEPPPGVAIINPHDTTIQLGDRITLNASVFPYPQSSINAYRWSPSEGLSCDDCANPVFSSYQKDNEYQLTITYNDICEATASATVIVEGEGTVYIPNAFSPNGDGNNDVFEIYGKQVKSSKIQIFNRWGEKVYDSIGGLMARWDGTYKGNMQPPMIYTYIAEIEFLNGKIKRQMGSLTLIR